MGKNKKSRNEGLNHDNGDFEKKNLVDSCKDFFFSRILKAVLTTKQKKSRD